MKDTLTLQRKTYDSRLGIARRYGVGVSTFHAWRKAGLLGEPVQIGRTKFYPREILEAALARGAWSFDPHRLAAIMREEAAANE